MFKNYYFIIYIFIMAALTVTLGTKPDYNWDMLAYMAIVKKMDGVKSFNEVHKTIYTEIKKNIPFKSYNDLVDSNNTYRKKMAEDAAAFETQLPYYNVKPVYLLSAFIFYKLGCSLIYATILPSLISFFFINIICFFWIKKIGLSLKASLLSLVLICVVSAPLAARSNPDGLSCLFLVIASCLFLEYKNLFLVFLSLLLSVLVRPDNIIISVLLFSVILLGKWKQKVLVYTSFIYLSVLILCYYLVQIVMSNPGWNSLFYHTFVDYSADTLTKRTITMPVYLEVLKENFLNIKGAALIVILSVLTIFILQPKKFNFRALQLYKFFYIAVVIWFILKSLLFPMLGFRFIIPPLLLLMMAILKAYEFKLKK